MIGIGKGPWRAGTVAPGPSSAAASARRAPGVLVHPGVDESRSRGRSRRSRPGGAPGPVHLVSNAVVLLSPRAGIRRDDLVSTETIYHVIVHHPGGLHVRIADRRAH